VDYYYEGIKYNPHKGEDYNDNFDVDIVLYDLDGNYLSGSILEHCIVEYAGGVSVTNNGAIRFENAHPFISSSTVHLNSASGIYAWDLTGTVRISKSNIGCNTSPSSGGGICIIGMNDVNSSVYLLDSFISENSSSGDGGGMHAFKSSVFIDNCTFIKNISSGSGGGMFHQDNTVEIINSTFINNTASGDGGAIQAYNFRDASCIQL